MKQNNVTIDINRLSVDELKQLSTMLYNMNRMADCKRVNEALSFIRGWMNDEDSKAYIARFCE